MIWNLVGKVNGRRIELETDPGLPPGTTVTVKIEPQPIQPTQSAEGIMASCGVWKDDEELARIFDEIARERAYRPCREADFDAPS